MSCILSISENGELYVLVKKLNTRNTYTMLELGIVNSLATVRNLASLYNSNFKRCSTKRSTIHAGSRRWVES